MFENIKSLFNKTKKSSTSKESSVSGENVEEVSLEDAPEEVSDSAGQEGYDDVAEIEELEYESE
jgi:hypothetical protein